MYVLHLPVLPDLDPGWRGGGLVLCWGLALHTFSREDVLTQTSAARSPRQSRRGPSGAAWHYGHPQGRWCWWLSVSAVSQGGRAQGTLVLWSYGQERGPSEVRGPHTAQVDGYLSLPTVSQ